MKKFRNFKKRNRRNITNVLPFLPGNFLVCLSSRKNRMVCPSPGWNFQIWNLQFLGLSVVQEKSNGLSITRLEFSDLKSAISAIYLINKYNTYRMLRFTYLMKQNTMSWLLSINQYSLFHGRTANCYADYAFVPLSPK